jgi:hypothetical protein
MEGHPGYEDLRAAPARGRFDSSDVARTQAFVLLEAERRSLTAQLRPAWRPSGRYEDLSLVIMLARLERDWLSLALAGWAMSWGTAPRTRLDADIAQMGDALEGLGRWLPRRTVAKAEHRARRRLAIIATALREPGPRAWTAVPAPTHGPAPDGPRFEAPSRGRVAAVAALLCLGAGVGAFLLAGTEQGSGPDSIRGAGVGPALGENQRMTTVQVDGGSGQGRRGPDRSGNRVTSSQAKGCPPEFGYEC